jgi:hypothetical protein
MEPAVHEANGFDRRYLHEWEQRRVRDLLIEESEISSNKENIIRK